MAERLIVRVLRLAHGADLPLPETASAGSAGVDLRAAIESEVPIRPGERVQVPTGLVLELPDGWEGQVRPRSGLAWRHGLTLLNSPGTIDSDYRGEVKIILANLGQEYVTIRRGDRIAQRVSAPGTHVTFEESSDLVGSERGEGGFGSTGVD